MKNLTVKAKLSLLMIVAVLALLITSGVGILGLKDTTMAINEIGHKRLPFVRLAEHFQSPESQHKRENIVVVKYGNLKAGFVVDELMGEFQTVIKPLGPLFERLPGISGSTILGSGEVALILDAPSLINMAIQRDNKNGVAMQPLLH